MTQPTGPQLLAKHSSGFAPKLSWPKRLKIVSVSLTTVILLGYAISIPVVFFWAQDETHPQSQTAASTPNQPPGVFQPPKTPPLSEKTKVKGLMLLLFVGVLAIGALILFPIALVGVVGGLRGKKSADIFLVLDDFDNFFLFWLVVVGSGITLLVVSLVNPKLLPLNACLPFWAVVASLGIVYILLRARLGWK